MCGLTTVPTPARYLLLDNNTLNGTIPRNFGQLTALQALSVANNKLVGGIPDGLTNLTGTLTYAGQ